MFFLLKLVVSQVYIFFLNLRKDLDVCNMILDKQEGILYYFNVRKIKILDLAFEASISMQRWDDALSYGTKLLNGFR